MTMLRHLSIAFLCSAMISVHAAYGSDLASSVRDEIDAMYSSLEALYIDLHQNPELSKQEKKTSAKIAGRMRALGFEVTTDVGGHGVVGIMKNGAGPIIMIRTDLDALPIEEKTGLRYASRARATDDSGTEVGVMHACGHDVHMTALVGTAAILAKWKNRWRGTLMLVGQPAEEVLSGARAMIADGLFTRFPRPDVVLGIHQDAALPSGKIGFISGFAQASADSIDLVIYGTGGHGARPHMTVDPIVIAARTIIALQTIVARENDPMDPAVVTVGSIHGGAKHNIIPSEVRLQLTVRSHRDEVQKRLLAAIDRIAKAEAASARAPQPPVMSVIESTKALYNDPETGARIVAALRRALGNGAVTDLRPIMGSEDFSEYVNAGVPGVFLRIGSADPARHAAAEAGGPPLASGHSPVYAPHLEPTLRTAVLTETLAALELLGRN